MSYLLIYQLKKQATQEIIAMFHFFYHEFVIHV